MQIEEVRVSTFYRALLTRYRSVWYDRVKSCDRRLRKEEGCKRDTIESGEKEEGRREVRKDWIVCVPQSCSLIGPVTRLDIENHVMRPMSGPGIFETLNGRRVVILGNKVTTKRGFPTPCTARVLYTHQGEEEGSFHVLFLNKPLEGGLDAPGESDELTPDMINKFMALLRARSELEDVLTSLDRFSRSIQNICKARRTHSVKPCLRDCVRNAVCRTSNVIVASFDRDAATRSEIFALRIQQTLECYAMRQLHDDIFALVRRDVADDDLELSRAIEAHSSVDKRTLGVAEEFDCSTIEAETKLRSLATCRTPLEQAQCIAATSRLIKSSVESHYRAAMQRDPQASYREFATDDLLCIIIYVLTRCGNAHTLFACFEYIERYHFSSITTTAIGFHVSHFQVAAEWLVDAYRRRLREGIGGSKSTDTSKNGSRTAR